MIAVNSKIISGSAGKPILIDVRHLEDDQKKSVIIFSHGFKGYKDWGAFNLMADCFAKAGFIFIKFNFSHNGGTMDNPIDFPDLEAFGQNNYSTELNDLGLVIDAVHSGQLIDKSHIQLNNIVLMGHSRGGGISILKAAEDSRICKLVTLAAVSDFEPRFPSGTPLQKWMKDGVDYILNSRTKQKMPLYYQFYQDFIDNRIRLDIPSATKRLSIPYLIIHGSSDETVSQEAAENLHHWAANATLTILPDANHTFGMKHPWKLNELPRLFEQALDEIVNFLRG